MHKYATAGRDGVVKIWSGNQQGMSQIHNMNIGSSWITSIAVMNLS